MDPIFRLPPWRLQAVTTPLAEVHDWSLAFLGISDLWKKTRGKGIKVAILDTGTSPDHPDLSGAVVEAKDFTGSPWGPVDRQGHGTWCCAQVGARANDVGCVGIAPMVSLYSGKVLDDGGSGTDVTIGAGMRWAIDLDVDIISMSLGGPVMSEELHELFKTFTSKPAHFIFAAAGNDGSGVNTVNFPGRWLETICVAAVDKFGKRAPFSSMGPRVDIAAPGVDMIAAIPGGYGKMSGTSMATPTAAAVGALALSKHKELGGLTDLVTVGDMREHLRKTAIDKGDAGRDDEYGFGLIDPAKLLADEMHEPAPWAGGEYKFGDFTVHAPAKQGDKISATW